MNDGLPEPFNPQPGELPHTGPAFVKFVSDRFEKLERHLGKVVDHLQPRDKVYRKIATVASDASGKARLEVINVPAGHELFLHRLYVNVDGATFAAPVTGGQISIQVDGQEEDGLSIGTVGLPQVFTASSSAAIVYDEGETVEVFVTGVTASRTVTCIARGHLVRSRLDVNAP